MGGLHCLSLRRPIFTEGVCQVRDLHFDDLADETTLQFDEDFKSVKVLVAHCSEEDIKARTIDVWNEDVHLEWSDCEAMIQVENFFDWNTNEPPKISVNLDGCRTDEEKAARYRFQSNIRSWKKCFDWYREEYKQPPAVDHEAGRIRGRE